MNRPFGVTLLAILALIFGVVVTVAGILLVRDGVVSGATVPAILSGKLNGVKDIAIGLALLLVGVLSVGFALGAFRGASWSWIFGIVGQLVNLVVSIVQLVIGIAQGDVTNAIISNVLSIAVAIIILVYLNRPTAKAYFRRAQLVRVRLMPLDRMVARPLTKWRPRGGVRADEKTGRGWEYANNAARRGDRAGRRRRGAGARRGDLWRRWGELPDEHR